MNARTGRMLQRFPRSLDVGATGARQSRDDRAPDDTGNGLDRLKIPVGRDRKPSFDHIHSQAVELQSQPHLFLLVHAATRRLLAVAKSRVENRYARSFWIHWLLPRGRAG